MGPKSGVGFGDAVSADVRLAAIFSRGHSREDAPVREERYPIGTTFETRFVGGNPSGNTKRQPMLIGLTRSKIQAERLDIPSWKIDGKMISSAGGERKSKANLDEDRDGLHLGTIRDEEGANE